VIHTLFLTAYAIAMLALFVIAVTTLAWMIDSWRTPAALGQMPFPEPDEPRLTFSLIVPARHEEAVLADTVQRLLDLCHFVAEQKSRLFVKRTEWLVHQKNFRLGCQSTRDGDPLAHAAGQLRRIAPLEAIEADHVDEVARPLLALRPRHFSQLQRKRDIVQHGTPGKRRLLLEHHPDRRMRARDLLAPDPNFAAVVADEPADDIEQSGFSAPRWSNHRQKLTLTHRKGYVIDRDHAAILCVKALHDIVDDEDIAAKRRGD